LLATEEARAAGFDQVLWLDATERRYLEEMGTMNVMVQIGDEVLTPPLGGTILAGIVRDSVLTLLHDWEIPVSERSIGVAEIVAASRAGTLREAWGTGTASGIQPIGELSYRGERFPISDPGPDKLSRRLSQALAAIQYGTAPDTHGWMVPL
jgi:branched-chain amino acid aminotransferase